MDPNLTPRKVTLSCRVYPEQKFLIAEQARKLDMSLAQYVEAKILKEDNYELEERIRQQQMEIERLKSHLAKSAEIRNREIENLKVQLSKQLKSMHKNIRSELEYDFPHFLLEFNSEKELKTFTKILQRLAKNHQFKDLESVLKMCVKYTDENDESFFFIKTVKGFIKEHYQN